MTRPKRGDRVRIVWVDIYEEPTEHPENVAPKVCHSVGYWLGWKSLDVEGKATRYALTSDTRMGEEFMGATAIPKGCVVAVEVLK